MNKLLFAMGMFLVAVFPADGQTVLQGQISDEIDPLVGATVKAVQNGQVIRGALSDVDGEYRMTVDSGTYEVEVSYTGCTTEKVGNVEVLPGRLNLLNITLTSGFSRYKLEMCHYGPPIFNQDATESGSTFTATQIRHMF